MSSKFIVDGGCTQTRMRNARVEKQLLCCFNFCHFNSAVCSIWALCFPFNLPSVAVCNYDDDESWLPSSCSLSSFVGALWFGLILSLGFVFCSRCSFHRSSIRWRSLYRCVCVRVSSAMIVIFSIERTIRHTRRTVHAHPVSTLSTRTLIFLSTQLPTAQWMVFNCCHLHIKRKYLPLSLIFLCSSMLFSLRLFFFFSLAFHLTFFSPFRQLQFFMMFLYNFLLAGCILFLPST